MNYNLTTRTRTCIISVHIQYYKITRQGGKRNLNDDIWMDLLEFICLKKPTLL